VRNSGRAPLVTVMQAADLRNGKDPSSICGLDRSGLRGVILQRQVGPGPMVIGSEVF
jgi:hypothetical protein